MSAPTSGWLPTRIQASPVRPDIRSTSRSPRPSASRARRVAVRILLAIPALLLAAILGAGAGERPRRRARAIGRGGASTGVGGVAAVCAFLGWFASLARGRMPSGLRDLGRLRHRVRGAGLRIHCSSSPTAIRPPTRTRSVRPGACRRTLCASRSTTTAARSRLTVAFRLLLALPHLVWLVLWSIAALLAAIANWFVALVRGRAAESLHRFLAAYVRYTVHARRRSCSSWPTPSPASSARAGYPVDLTIAPAEQQSRWITLFRTFLALPAFLLAGALSGAIVVVGILGWFAALVTGRMPTGLRNLGAVSIRYQAQTHVYWFVLNDRYPYASPALRAAGRARGDRLTNRSVALRALAALVFVAAWAAAAWSLWDSVVPGESRARPTSDIDGVPQEHPRPRRPLRALLPDRVRPLAARPPRRRWSLYAKHGAPLRQGVGGRPNRHRDAARDDRARARLALAAAVPARGGVVGPPLRPDRERLRRVDLRRLGRARRRVPVHLPRARRRDGARGDVPSAAGGSGAAPFFVGLAFLFGFIYPYLDPTEPLRRADLLAAGREYAAKQGIEPVPLRVEDVTDFTSAPNAYAVGFGPSKRIVFWNTLLDGSFTDAEVKTVLAHELGHHSSDHMPRGIALVRALRAPGSLADRGRDPAARRDGEPRRGTARAARRRRAPPALAARLQRDLPAHGGGSRLEGARDDPRPRGGGGLFKGSRSSRSTTRPTRLVVRALRQPPLRRAADRDGRGLAATRS